MRTLLTRVGWIPVAIIAVVITIALLALLLPGRTSTSPATNALNPTAAAPTSAASPSEAASAVSAGQASSPAPQQSPGAAPGAPSVTAGGSGGTSGGTSGAGQPAAPSPVPVTPEPTLPLRATQQAAAKAATDSEGQRYIDMARKAVPEAPRPGSAWDVQVIPDEGGTAVMLVMPLSQAPSSVSALGAAKQRIADVVNAVFVNDSKVVRVGVVGTYQNSTGREAPAISLIVRKAASPRWGSVTPAELERLAQNLYISAEFQK